MDNAEFGKIGKTGGILKNIESRKKPTSVSGIVEIKNILKSIEKGENEFDFIEGFICESGCENGGGKK